MERIYSDEPDSDASRGTTTSYRYLERDISNDAMKNPSAPIQVVAEIPFVPPSLVLPLLDQRQNHFAGRGPPWLRPGHR
jgi:hypothetical protein